MLLAGLNYANSLALLLTFLLAGFALVAMQHVTATCSVPLVCALSAPPVFAGTAARLQLTLEQRSAGGRGCSSRPPAGDTPVVTADLPRQGARAASAAAAAGARRGVGAHRAAAARHRPALRPVPRLDLGARAARAPGLSAAATARCRCPARRRRKPGTHSAARRRRGRVAHGLRPFRDGDSPRQVDWKAYAREAPLLVKEYSPRRRGAAPVRFRALADSRHRGAPVAAGALGGRCRGARRALRTGAAAVRIRAGPRPRSIGTAACRAGAAWSAESPACARGSASARPTTAAAQPGCCAAFAGGVLLHVDRLPLWACGGSPGTRRRGGC